jgi:hypothetical protein
MEFTLTPHLIKQAEAKGIALNLIWEALRNPENTYGSFRKDPATGNREPYRCRQHGGEQQKWTATTSNGTKLCVVVNPCCGTVITVWLDQVETALRADQKDAGVTGYTSTDGRWFHGGVAPEGEAKAQPKRKPLTAKQKRAAKKARHARRQAGQ